MERIYAHKIIYDGTSYRNHVMELSDDGHVRLFPFAGEIHSTRFISGSVTVTVEGNPPHLRPISHKP